MQIWFQLSTPPLTLEGYSSVRNPRKFSLIKRHIPVYTGKPLTSGRPTTQNRMWGKVTSIETCEDVQILERALSIVADNGQEEALAEPLED